MGNSIDYTDTVKVLLSPLGGLFNFGPSRGGLIREGGLFTKSGDKDIFGSFSVLLSHILWNQHTILRLKYTNSTQFLSQTISKLTCKVVSLSKWKYLVNSRTLNEWGGLNRGGIFSIFDQEEGAY